jgi:hypothetical protein
MWVRSVCEQQHGDSQKLTSKEGEDGKSSYKKSQTGKTLINNASKYIEGAVHRPPKIHFDP